MRNMGNRYVNDTCLGLKKIYKYGKMDPTCVFGCGLHVHVYVLRIVANVSKVTVPIVS